MNVRFEMAPAIPLRYAPQRAKQKAKFLSAQRPVELAADRPIVALKNATSGDLKKQRRAMSGSYWPVNR